MNRSQVADTRRSSLRRPSRILLSGWEGWPGIALVEALERVNADLVLLGWGGGCIPEDCEEGPPDWPLIEAGLRHHDVRDVDPADPAQLVDVLADLACRGFMPDAVVELMTLQPGDSVTAAGVRCPSWVRDAGRWSEAALGSRVPVHLIGVITHSDEAVATRVRACARQGLQELGHRLRTCGVTVVVHDPVAHLPLSIPWPMPSATHLEQQTVLRRWAASRVDRMCSPPAGDDPGRRLLSPSPGPCDPVGPGIESRSRTS